MKFNFNLRNHLTWLTRTGFGLSLVLSILISIGAVYALRTVTANNRVVVGRYSDDLMLAKELRTLAHQNIAIVRGFLLTRDRLFLEDLEVKYGLFNETLGKLRSHDTLSKEGRIKLDTIEHHFHLQQKEFNKVTLMRIRRASVARVGRYFNEHITPAFNAFELTIDAFVKQKEAKLEAARRTARENSQRTIHFVTWVTFGSLFLVGSLAFLLTRTLADLYEKNRKAVTAREEALAVVTHDLRNPLTSLQLGLSIIQKSATHHSPIRELAGTLTQSAKQMNRLIMDLMDFSKLEAGHFPVVLHEEEFPSLLKLAVQGLEPLAASKGIRFTLDTESAPEKIRCDRDRLLQVLSNLIGNAIKFTPKNGNVSVSTYQQSDLVLVRVKDSGPGIPKKELGRIFDRHWSARKFEKQGAGLGLFIAKGIIDAHGGEIWAHCPTDGGTEMFFTLPFEAPVLAGLTQASAVTESRTSRNGN